MPDRIDREDRDKPLRVLIAGGGIAGCEAALALDDSAGDLVDVTIVEPRDELVYRPLSVGEPFGIAHAERYPLPAIAREANASLVSDALSWVDADDRLVHTRDGEALPYDALLLALGTRLVDEYPEAHTLSDRNMEDSFRGIIQDLELGYVRRIAFVMPPGPAWPLPLYELALMTAERARSMCVDADVTIVTPERSPLEIFGRAASAVVAELLRDGGIETVCGASASVPWSTRVTLQPEGDHIDVDRVIALPKLLGPGVRGLRSGPHGFIPVDHHARVTGQDRVFAAGDATSYPVKHGGISARQADVAAAEIARLAGADAQPLGFLPEIHGMLLTGRDPLYFEARVIGAAGFQSKFSKDPLWSPAAKIDARHLAPVLIGLDGEPARG